MQHKNLQKVLVIRFSSIGDIVLCSPVFRTLKNQLQTEIHWLTKSDFAFVNEHNPYIDKLYTFDRNLKETIEELKSENYDLIIDLHKNIRTSRVKKGLKQPSLTLDKINCEKWVLVNFRQSIMRDPRHLVGRSFAALDEIGIQNDGEGLDYCYGSETKKPVPVTSYI